MGPKSKTPDLDEIVAQSFDDAGVGSDPPENYDGPAPSANAQMEGATVADEPPASGTFQPPAQRSGLANCVCDDLPPLGASAHDILLNLHGFHQYWAARSDPADLAHHIGVRITTLLGRTPRQA
jgi:hypothetical protein